MRTSAFYRQHRVTDNLFKMLIVTAKQSQLGPLIHKELHLSEDNLHNRKMEG